MLRVSREQKNEAEEEEEEEEQQEEVVDDDDEVARRSRFESMSYAEKQLYIAQMKEQLASLASEIIEKPEDKVGKIQELLEIVNEPLLTLKKLSVLTIFAVFKDILPSYRIRPLTEEERSAKVSKEVQKTRRFEENLLKFYQTFLNLLENLVKKYRQVRRHANKVKNRSVDLLEEDVDVEVNSTEKLAVIAMKCMCDLLIHNPDFNFRNNLLLSIVPRMNVHDPEEISNLSCEAIINMFKVDAFGEASLEAVRAISNFVKSKSYNVLPKMIETLLYLRLIEELEPEKPQEHKPKEKKKKKEFINKKQRKQMKEDKKLQLDMKEAEAEYSKTEKKRFHTETLKVVFQIYFRVLKNMKSSPVLQEVLKGLGKFSHLISIDFFSDLMKVLKLSIENNFMDLPTSLQCIICAYQVIIGQGESALELDLRDFTLQLYRLLPSLLLERDHLDLALEALDYVILHRKQLASERVAAYAKRLISFSANLSPNAILASLAMAGLIFQKYPKVQALIENESSGMGTYRWDIDDPDLCHAFEATLWELTILQKHFHPIVAKTASLLASNQLGLTKKPSEIFQMFDSSQGKLTPTPDLPRPHPLQKFAEKRAKFITPPVNESQFLINLQSQEATFDESQIEKEFRETFAIRKGSKSIGKLEKKLNYTQLLIQKWRQYQKQPKKFVKKN